MDLRRTKSLIVAVLAVGMLFNGCGSSGTSDSQSHSTVETVSSNTEVASENAEVESGLQAESVPQEETESDVFSSGLEEDMVISTIYGDLHYDGQWRDSLVTEETDEDNVARVTFTAVINEVNYPLFTVIIGGDGEDSVGILTDSEGTERNVSIEPYSLEEDNELSESEQDRFHAMKDSINYLIDNLK